ncbi:hypothetical protein IAR50_001263 [Cryptococcus sp. DSM 104548]
MVRISQTFHLLGVLGEGLAGSSEAFGARGRGFWRRAFLASAFEVREGPGDDADLFDGIVSTYLSPQLLELASMETGSDVFGVRGAQFDASRDR